MILQAACVPFRRVECGYEIMLVTTRKGKWTLPKGVVDPGETPKQTAVKEALEEAGVIGEIEGEAFGFFTYRKWGEDLKVDVFLLNVKETLDDFSESDFRERRWLTPEEASRRIRKRMRRVLREGIALLKGF